MRILISGITGAMGKEVEKLCRSGYMGAELAGGVAPDAVEGSMDVPVATDFSKAITDVDCVVDFSNHAATGALLDFVTANHLPLVLATTGQTDEEREMIEQAAKEVPVFFATNYSLGVALQPCRMLKLRLSRSIITAR